MKRPYKKYFYFGKVIVEVALTRTYPYLWWCWRRDRQDKNVFHRDLYYLDFSKIRHKRTKKYAYRFIAGPVSITFGNRRKVIGE